MADIAVLGHGVVGSGVLEVLLTHTDSITRRAKEEIRVKHILDLREFPELPYAGSFTKDFNVILEDPEVTIVVECMGGLEPAYTFVRSCLENGKSVVTSNKELVAQKGAELLASLAFGTHVYPDDVHTEGITKVTLEDVAYADAWGGVIKLIGQVSMLENGRIAIMVAPMLISRESQLANVDDVFNGIVVRGDATGDVMFYGKGAGKLPTASAVVADVIDCVKHLKARKYLFWEDAKPDYIEPFENIKGDFFLRVQGDCSSDEAFARAAQALPGAARIVRREEAPGEAGVTVKNISEAGITECLKQLEQSGVRVLDRLRISDF